MADKNDSDVNASGHVNSAILPLTCPALGQARVLPPLTSPICLRLPPPEICFANSTHKEETGY